MNTQRKHGNSRQLVHQRLVYVLRLRCARESTDPNSPASPGCCELLSTRHALAIVDNIEVAKAVIFLAS